MELAPVTVQVSVTGMSGDNAVIQLQATGGAAPFTVLTTQATGRFSDNAFLLIPGDPVIIQFIPFNNQAIGIQLIIRFFFSFIMRRFSSVAVHSASRIHAIIPININYFQVDSPRKPQKFALHFD